MQISLSNAAQQHIKHTQKFILSQLKLHNNWLSFAQYMQHVLYTPNIGYYVTAQHKFGPGGDFVTAAEISPLFGYSLAQSIKNLLCAHLSKYDILEFGAGSGKLATAILQHSEKISFVPENYYILEPSSELQSRQKQYLQQNLSTSLYNKIIWLNQPPTTKITGIILANEVLDAMPVHLYSYVNKNLQEIGVSEKQEKLVLSARQPSNNLQQYCQDYSLFKDCSSDIYRSEAHLFAANWTQQLSSYLHQGYALLIDYGYDQYTAFQRSNAAYGTLRCFCQHRIHNDPLLYPGVQDITSNINFSIIIQVAQKFGWQLKSFSSQAEFLLAAGILDIFSQIQQNNDYKIDINHYQLSQQMQKLLMPQHMGEIFKVLCLERIK